MIKFVTLLVLFTLSLHANTDLAEYIDVVEKELGVLSFLVDGFSIDSDGILTVSPSFYAFAISILLPSLVFVLISFYFPGQYNAIIGSLIVLVIILILALGISSSSSKIQKSYEAKLSKKYKIKRPFSIFFNSSH